MKIIEFLKRFANTALDKVYPEKCMFCYDVIPIGMGKDICPNCRRFSEISSPNSPNLLYLYEYSDYVSEMIHRFKYYDHPEYAEKLGELSAEKVKAFDLENVDIIIAVPMYASKKRKRGYDQAELIADKMGELLGIPVEHNALIRTRKTKPQSLTERKDKAKNLKDAFKVVDSKLVSGKNIILVDDIYTSGSTTKYCRKELIANGANNIYIFVLAIANQAIVRRMKKIASIIEEVI